MEWQYIAKVKSVKTLAYGGIAFTAISCQGKTQAFVQSPNDRE
jgi:hypothetical protein